jgi:modulator of FtsH protease
LTGGPITDWNTLLAVEAGAAATLIGLIFVALSVNLTKILAYPGLPGRAVESILQFLAVFLIATMGLIPHQSETALATEFIAIGVSLWILQAWLQVRYLKMRAGHPWSWFIYRAVLGHLATVPFCVAGIVLLLDGPGALYWLVPGFVFSFLSGVVGAWVLLVEILR